MMEDVYISGCKRCHLFAELQFGIGGVYPELTQGMGGDCERHRCSLCALAAPEEGHTCEQAYGEPICDECEESI